MKTINTGKYIIHIGTDSFTQLDKLLSSASYPSVIILVDENTKKKCLPLLKRSFSRPRSISIIQMKSGETNKNIRVCEKIWKELSRMSAGRDSLLINLGGGVISDIGGFVASTYKRGIDFLNIPTTLLAQADASIGGKTGIDFSDYKNQIGTFAFPKAIFIDPGFLQSLNKRELLSGFAEMIKHGLIADREYWNRLQTSSPSLLLQEQGCSGDEWSKMILDSIQIKNNIVIHDPYEKGLRKALNFGHTIGHAIESASLRSKKKMLHGEAIALGMICEAYLSRKCCRLSSEDLNSITKYIISVFNPKPVRIPAKRLISLMKQDKKNKDTEINFTLLHGIGTAVINNTCSDELIEEALRYLNSECK